MEWCNVLTFSLYLFFAVLEVFLGDGLKCWKIRKLTITKKWYCADSTIKRNRKFVPLQEWQYFDQESGNERAVCGFSIPIGFICIVNQTRKVCSCFLQKEASPERLIFQFFFLWYFHFFVQFFHRQTIATFYKVWSDKKGMEDEQFS